MVNTYRIITKELYDLLGDRFLLFIGCFYVLIILIQVMNINNDINNYHLQDVAPLFSSGLGGLINYYGVILAIIIGYASIDSERREDALNILLTKPVYRDNIINGKMIGSLVYLLCLYLFGSFIFVAFSFILCGDIFSGVFIQFVSMIVPITIASLACAMVFYSLSLLLAIIFRGSGLSLILVVFFWVFGQMASDVSISGNISYIIESMGIASSSEVGYFIMGIMPYGILSNFFAVMTSRTDYSSLSMVLDINIMKLAIYALVLLIASHITFLRSDIS